MIVDIDETKRLEGDYIETIEGLLFAVKGVHHPPGLTIAYLRYLPKPKGERMRDGRRYDRLYDIEHTEKLLRQNFPHYLNHIEKLSLTLQSVPSKYIFKIYDPRKKLREITEKPESHLQEKIAKLIMAFQSKGIDIKTLGILGSLLINLAGSDSDIDIVVYGRENGKKVYESLKELRKETRWIAAYNEENVADVVLSRWADSELNLKELGSLEIQKVLHGRVDGIDYFLRLLKLPQEVEIEDHSRPLGVVKLKARITEDNDAIYAPCSYLIEDCKYLDSKGLPIASQLFSYRGKFTEQAKKGDLVEAKGTLEEVVTRGEKSFRVILGRKGDYLIPMGKRDTFF
jgi:predicted nucleotidyltransferase|tara:strand:+ start:2253 stop:3281 length:1029 start_codon:yes stop_codon:yes gene_type:complete